jgi:hypothetical protein
MVNVFQTPVSSLPYGRWSLLALSLFTAMILAGTAPGSPAAAEPPPVETTPPPPTETQPAPPTETQPAPPTETQPAPPIERPPPGPTEIIVTVPPPGAVANVVRRTKPGASTVRRRAKPTRTATTSTVQVAVTPARRQPVWQPIERRSAPTPRAVKPTKELTPQKPPKSRSSRPSARTPLESQFAAALGSPPKSGPAASAGGAALTAPSVSEKEALPLASDLLIALGLSGILLLCIAGATPALAHRWPRVFAPLLTRRAGASSLGLSALVTVLLTWAIAGSGA